MGRAFHAPGKAVVSCRLDKRKERGPMRRTCLSTSCALLVTLAAAAHAELKDVTPAGFTAENTVQVPADPATAWRALVEDVDRWWPKDHTWWGAESRLSIEPRAGGCFCERNGA